MAILSRREFLRVSALAATGGIVTACQPKIIPNPKPTGGDPTEKEATPVPKLAPKIVQRPATATTTTAAEKKLPTPISEHPRSGQEEIAELPLDQHLADFKEKKIPLPPLPKNRAEMFIIQRQPAVTVAEPAPSLVNKEISEIISPPCFSEKPSDKDRLLTLTPEDVAFIGNHEIVSGRKDPPMVAATFDAGSVSEPWPVIKQVLEKFNASVTVFLTGAFISQNSGYIKQMLNMNLEIGNHSTNHPDFAKITAEEMVFEITEFQKRLNNAAGRYIPVRFFRFPFGSRNRNCLEVLASLGLQSVYWSPGGDSGGWRTEFTEKEVLDNLLKNIRPGQISIQHIGSQHDANVLERYFNAISTRGLKIGTVSEVVDSKDIPPSIAVAKESCPDCRLGFGFPAQIQL